MSVYGGPGGVGGVPPQGQAYAQPPKVRFDAIGEAWSLFQQKMGVWVPTVLLFMVIMVVAEMIFFAIMGVVGLRPSSAPGQPPELGPGVFLGFPILMILLMGAGALFMGGMMKMALKQVRGEEIAIGDIFSATDTIGPLIVAGLLVGLGTSIGSYLCVIPGLIVGGMCMLTNPLIVDQKVGATQAISMSWNALKGDMLTATLFYFVLSLVVALGGVLCGVGALFTIPLLPLALAITYRDFFLNTGGPQAPSLDMPLPPPSAYQPGQYPPPPQQ